MASPTASPGELAARILWRLVETPSPSGREEEAARVFVEEARGLGLRAWRDSVGNVFAAPPEAPEKPLVLLAGHIDTVDDWYAPRRTRDTIEGRGAVDAKGPLAAMLAAVAVLAQENPGAPVHVAGLVGEEADSRGAWHLLETGRVPRHVVIGEPTGSTRVAIGYRGSARVEVSCRGRGGHPSTPWAADSALEKIVDFLYRLRMEHSSATVNTPSITPTYVSSGTGANVVPTSARALLDVRIPPQGSLEEALARIEQLLPGDCAARLVGDYTPPVRVSLNEPVPRALVRAIVSLGKRAVPVVKAGTSDMNILARATRSIAAYGPGDPSLAHTRMERVSVQELGFAARVYARAAEALAAQG